MRSAEFALQPPESTSPPLSSALAALEGALADGDLGAAQRRASDLRRCLEGQPSRPARTDGRPRLRLVTGVPLTSRETAALRLLTDGSLSQKDIARSMGVTTNTLKTHLKALYLKLGAHCRGEAIQRARDAGILAGVGVQSLAHE